MPKPVFKIENIVAELKPLPLWRCPKCGARCAAGKDCRGCGYDPNPFKRPWPLQTA